MDAELIKSQIAEETKGDTFPCKWNVLDLRECLVEPAKKIYKDASQPAARGNIELWLVLEECPNAKDGYEIVYDENENVYGLAYSYGSQDDFIGYYGSFLETLEAM